MCINLLIRFRVQLHRYKTLISDNIKPNRLLQNQPPFRLIYRLCSGLSKQVKFDVLLLRSISAVRMNINHAFSFGQCACSRLFPPSPPVSHNLNDRVAFCRRHATDCISTSHVTLNTQTLWVLKINEQEETFPNGERRLMQKLALSALPVQLLGYRRALARNCSSEVFGLSCNNFSQCVSLGLAGKLQACRFIKKVWWGLGHEWVTSINDERMKVYDALKMY